jgi:hypothetical protein
LRNSKQPSTLMRFKIGDSARSKTIISPDGMLTSAPSTGNTPDGQVAGEDQSLVVPVHEVGGLGGAHHGTRLSRHLTPFS